MSNEDKARSEMQMSVHACYRAMNVAWSTIQATQAAMEADGWPAPIIALLDKPRLAVSDTSMFPGLVDAIDAVEQMACKSQEKS